MSNSVALLISGVLIAAALAAGLMVDRYQIAGAFTVDGAPAVWRLNVRNGSVSLCILTTHEQAPGANPADTFGVQCRN